MPSVSGNVGAVFNGGTISTPLAINPGDVTALHLAAVANANANNLTISVDDAHPAILGYVSDTEADIFVAASTTGGLPQVDIYADSATGLVRLRRLDRTEIRLLASAATDWLEIIMGAATPFRIDPDGYLVVALHSALADGALSAGEMALWFDQTNGAAKLMVKAKQADGTVRTGSLALA